MTRFGVSGHAAFELPGGTDGYLEANFMQDQVEFASYYGLPSTIYGTAPTGIFNPQFRTSGIGGPGTIYAAGSETLYLPVYVCSERVNCSTAADRTLNPNDPFAASGHDARLIGRDWINATPSDQTQDRSYRIAGGIKRFLLQQLAIQCRLHGDAHRSLRDGQWFRLHPAPSGCDQ